MMALIPPHPWIQAVVAITGTLVCLYSFLGRLWKGTFLTSEVMAATAVGVIIGPAAANIVDPQKQLSRHTFYSIVEEVRMLYLGWHVAPRVYSKELRAE